jgi:hypothetical protein
MTLSHRIALAFFILVVDLVTFALPLSAIAVAYVIVVRPRRFLEWVLLLYRDDRA